jgi:hypothetical protein
MAANPKWTNYAVVKVPLRDLEALGFGVQLTPEQCPFESIRQAHASIFGVTGENRQQAIDLFGRCVTREPT